MKVVAGLIMTVLALAMFGLVGAAAYSMNDMTTVLKDERQVIAATTNCTVEGMRISVYKQGGKPNGPCDDREMSRLMLLSGMEPQARYKECSMPDNLRDFATVSNCLHFEDVGEEQVLADVLAKSVGCGGTPKKWQVIKKGKYKECMERLA